MSSLKFKNEQGEWQKVSGGANVVAFNGRIGTVQPRAGDYTAEMVGADEAGSAQKAFEDAKTYVDEAIANSGSGITISPDEPEDGDIWIDVDDMPENESLVVATFNGRNGDVVPQAGDYTAEMVGAAPVDHSHELSELGAAPADHTHDLGEFGQVVDAFEVGDVITTVRDYISDKWALCNGESVSGADCPDYIKYSKVWGGVQLSSDNAVNLTMVATDGTTVAVYAYKYGSSMIYVTDDLNADTWTTIDVNSISTGMPTYFGYLNGLWILAIDATLYVTDDLFGTWTTKTTVSIPAASTTPQINNVLYVNNMWVCCTNIREKNVDSSYTYIGTLLYANDIFGAWSYVLMTGKDCTVLYDVAYNDGMWLAVGANGSTSAILKSTNISSGWQNIGSAGQYVGGSNRNVMCCDDKWVVFGTYASTAVPFISISTDLTATSWSYTILSDITGAARPCGYYNGDLYIVYISTTDSRMYVAKTNGASATIDTIFQVGDSSTTYGIWSYSYFTWTDDGTSLIAAYDKTNTSNFYPCLLSNNWAALPIITIDGGNAFIKVVR